MTPETAFEQFKPTLEKLRSEGLSSFDFTWWSSRWYEFVGYKHNETKEEWERKRELNKIFPQVWDLYQSEFTKMPKNNTNPKLDYALLYAKEWRWKVFPLKERDKFPLFPTIHPKGDPLYGKCHGECGKLGHGFYDAVLDADTLRKWWLSAPQANIGIATGKESNLVVVDLDTAKGADINAFLQKYNLTVEWLEQTPIAQTGGGKHIYFSYPKNATIKNSASKLGDFIDVRGDGGYVVAPGSIHSTGVEYAWINNAESLLEFPQVLIDALEQPTVSQSQNSNPFIVPEAKEPFVVPNEIKQGGRNMGMTQIAGKLRSMGLGEKAILEALWAENPVVCQPPLDRNEIETIARSVSRYAPNEVLKKITNDDLEEKTEDYENTLKPYQLFDLLNMKFEKKEIIAFHLGKQDVGVIQAGTNAGKTTLLRNAALSMAAGRPFEPFYDGKRPVKICYFDFENDAQDVQRDLLEMVQVFTEEEKKNLAKNFSVLPKGLIAGELFQFNRNEKYAFELLHQNKIEFAIVDNVSAAYDLKDENSNSEVTQKIIKPLLKMAARTDCAFLFAHHYGKGKTELDKAGVHAGRGASALQSLSRVVFNMFGDVSKGEISTIECAKRKTDGGQCYRESFTLDADRWFHRKEFIVAPPKPKDLSQQVREFVNSYEYPKTVKTKEVILKFEAHYSIRMIKNALEDLVKTELIDKPKYGQYCKLDDDENVTAPTSKTVKNYYEKDDD